MISKIRSHGLVGLHPETPSALRETVGARVQVFEITPPHLASPPQGEEEHGVSRAEPVRVIWYI